MSVAWLKSKFYPVDISNSIVYNDPQPRERDCSYGVRYSLENTRTIGLKIVKYPHITQENGSGFLVLPPLPHRVNRWVTVHPLNPDREELMDVIGMVGQITAYVPSLYRPNNGNVWRVTLYNGRTLTFQAQELHWADTPEYALPRA